MALVNDGAVVEGGFIVTSISSGGSCNSASDTSHPLMSASSDGDDYTAPDVNKIDIMFEEIDVNGLLNIYVEDYQNVHDIVDGIHHTMADIHTSVPESVADIHHMRGRNIYDYPNMPMAELPQPNTSELVIELEEPVKKLKAPRKWPQSNEVVWIDEGDPISRKKKKAAPPASKKIQADNGENQIKSPTHRIII